MMAIVLDASVVAAWVFQDEDNSPKADIIMGEISDYSVIVPRVFWYEICNTLLKGERNKRIEYKASDGVIDNLRQFRFITDKRQNEYQILKIGRQYNLTGYDAAYLVAAIDHNAMLATFDGPLSKATMKAGGSLFV